VYIEGGFGAVVAVVTLVTQLKSLIYKLRFILQVNILSEFPVADLKMCDIAK